jgi:ATP-dependent DNA ligase
MNKTLSQLRQECELLKLDVRQSGKRQAKSDYINALRLHYMRRDFPTGSPYQPLQPMLCFPFWSLKADERERVWRDGNNWVCQEKINGCRVLLHFVKDRGVFAQSRNLNSLTYRFHDLTPCLLFRDWVPPFDAVIDTECIVSSDVDTAPFVEGGSRLKADTLQAVTALLQMKPESSRAVQVSQGAPLHFRVFDIPFWVGKDLRKKRLSERLPYLSDFFAAITKATDVLPYLEVLPVHLHGKYLFYQRVIAQGGEGCVLKCLDSVYQSNIQRDRRGWVKIKKFVELTAFVSGFQLGKDGSRWRGKAAALEFSVDTEQGRHLIGKVVAIPKKLRNSALVRDQTTKELKLHPDLDGRVAHLMGLSLTAKSLRLQHPKVVKWERLRVAGQCSYSMAGIRDGQQLLPLVSERDQSTESAGGKNEGQIR